MSKSKKRGRPLFFIVGIISSISSFILVSIILFDKNKLTPNILYIIYILGFVSVFSPFIIMVVDSLGWLSNQTTCRKPFAEIGQETFFAFRPFFQDLIQSISSRPAVGVVGIIVSCFFSMCILYWIPGHGSTAELISLAIGVSGLLFGILGYHVAIRVERSIRDTITDFREFLLVVSNILETEILCEKSKLKKFYGRQDVEQKPTTYPDLILLLWFPHYGLTKDFNSIGLEIDRQLKRIQDLACRTYLITSNDPLSLMEYFNRHYDPKCKRYHPETLSRLAIRLHDAPPTKWEDIAETVKQEDPKIDLDDHKNEAVFEAISNLKSLMLPVNRYWSTIAIKNSDLMNGLVQIIWTPKKAAIVFLPPDCEDSSPDQPEVDSCSQQIITPRKAYKCSGFATDDSFMNIMIRELIELRFNI